MSEKLKVAVLGAGAWGTAYATVLADAGCSVRIWARREHVACAVNEKRRNEEYLPDVLLPDTLHATSDIDKAVEGAHAVVIAVPSVAVRGVMSDVAPLVKEGHTQHGVCFVSLVKGFEGSSGLRISHVIADVVGVEHHRVLVVTGPNIAQHIAARQPAGTVIACTDAQRARWWQRHANVPYLSTCPSVDVLGCELAGVSKNVVALAAGMSAAMGFGVNSTATLLTMGLEEITRLGVAIGARSSTFTSLAGLGDLIATCSSRASRNYRCGELLGGGVSLKTARKEISTVEGVHSCKILLQLAYRHGVCMPIAEQVGRVLYDNVPPREAVEVLMAR